MGKSCPLQNVQPFGGKFQLIILISPKNGSDIFLLLLFMRAQLCDGKSPNNEIMKLITRNGIMLSCGCEPPADPSAVGSIVTFGAASVYMLLPETAHTLFVGSA